jgi:small subunit ribosomal protein S15
MTHPASPKPVALQENQPKIQEKGVALNWDQFENILSQVRRHEGDSGSPEVQITRATYYIKKINHHMETHKKDFSSQRGLLGWVNQRRKLLRYLEKTQHPRFQWLCKFLGIRDKSEKTLSSLLHV